MVVVCVDLRLSHSSIRREHPSQMEQGKAEAVAAARQSTVAAERMLLTSLDSRLEEESGLLTTALKTEVERLGLQLDQQRAELEAFVGHQAKAERGAIEELMHSTLLHNAQEERALMATELQV